MKASVGLSLVDSDARVEGHREVAHRDEVHAAQWRGSDIFVCGGVWWRPRGWSGGRSPRCRGGGQQGIAVIACCGVREAAAGRVLACRLNLLRRVTAARPHWSTGRSSVVGGSLHIFRMEPEPRCSLGWVIRETGEGDGESCVWVVGPALIRGP